jgi:hypothetical protein
MDKEAPPLLASATTLLRRVFQLLINALTGKVFLGRPAVASYLALRLPRSSVNAISTTGTKPIVADAKCRNSANCCAMSARQKNFDGGDPENGRSAGKPCRSTRRRSASDATDDSVRICRRLWHFRRVLLGRSRDQAIHMRQSTWSASGLALTFESPSNLTKRTD